MGWSSGARGYAEREEKDISSLGVWFDQDMIGVLN